MRNIPDARRPKENTVSSWYVLGWCLCQDKPYGTIILTNVLFCAYKDSYKLWSFLSFYIWTLKKLLYKHRSMFWIFGCFDIVTIILFHKFCMSYHVWLCSCRPFNLTLILFLFITNYPIRKKHLSRDQLNLNKYYQKWTNIWQVINLQSIKSIKKEVTSYKVSILT